MGLPQRKRTPGEGQPSGRHDSWTPCLSPQQRGQALASWSILTTAEISARRGAGDHSLEGVGERGMEGVSPKIRKLKR